MVLAFLLTLPLANAGFIVSDEAGYPVASAMSHDTRHGLTLSNDGLVRLWDFPAGHNVKARFVSATHFKADFTAGFGFNTSPDVDMSTDGRFFAVGFKHTVQIWRTRPLRQLRTVRVDGDCDALAWALKQDLLFVHTRLSHGHVAGSTVIPVSGRPKHLDLDGPWTFSPRGDSVFGVTTKGIALANMRTCKITRRIQDKVEILPPYAFSPDGAYLVAGGEDPTWKPPDISDLPGPPTESFYAHTLKLNIWRVKGGKKVASLTGFGTSDGNASIRFQSSRRFAAIPLGEIIECPSGRVVKEFEVREPITDGWLLRARLPGSPGRTVAFPGRASNSNVVAFNSNGSSFALCGGTGSVADIAEFSARPLSLRSVTTMPADIHPTFALYSPQGELLTGLPRQTVRIHGGRAIRYNDAGGEPAPAYAPHIAASPDSPSDVASLRPKSPPSSDPEARQAAVLARSNLIRGAWFISFSATADGRRALAMPVMPTPRYPRELRMVDFSTGKTIWSEARYPFDSAPTLSADGSVVAVCGYAVGSVQGAKENIWLLAGKDGSEIDRIPLNGQIWNASVSPDGQSILANTNSGILVFDRKTHRLRFKVPLNQEGNSPKVFYSPDGRRIYRAFGETGLTAYDSENGHLRITLQRFGAKDWVAWSPEGDVAGTPGGIAHLYDTTKNGVKPRVGQRNPEKLSKALTG